jgi:hypothetical protein
MCRAKIFLHKVYGIHREFPPAKIVEHARIGRKAENQLVGIEGLTGLAVGLIEALAAVLSVSEERPAGIGHLGTNLVGSPGQKMAFHQGERPFGTDGFIFGNSTPGIVFTFAFDIDLVYGGIFEEKVF